MRTLAGALAVLSIVLAASSVLAQPIPTSSSDARVLDAGLVVVDTLWSEQRGQRSTRVVATIAGGRPVTLHEGTTVRTAIATSRDALVVVAFHGGEHAFARAILTPVRDGALGAPRTIELPRSSAQARSAMRPASALVASTPEGFTILVQEQDARSPAADVVTTMTRIDRDGALLGEPRPVAIPWALGALAWNGVGYHLAVLWGGWGDEHAGTARICLVTLSPEGSPQQHPWWASPFDQVGEVQLVARADGAMQLIWRRGDGRTIALHDAAQTGGWSVEPPPPRELATVAPDAPFAATMREGAIAIVTP